MNISIMNRVFLFFAAAVMTHALSLVAVCSPVVPDSCHFLTDTSYRRCVATDFAARCRLASGRHEALFAGMDTLPVAEREALQFLYAYMPYNDLADYDQAFFLRQVRYALAARDTFPWGRDIPDDIFRHFVLVYRVNNEDLDTARSLMFDALKQRVRHLSMEQAALEVNHWCHEHVAYRGADIRTSAPLATLRTALGRCGEESTFAVTALRAVGIPARQCYTPRWAHCDDNHAWVEVWVDGVWKFLGACEPDPRLNMGWFAVPSTRCMLVHSKAFGRYSGDEEVVRATPLFSELNLLDHYAPTRRLTARILDSAGHPVANAMVRFKLYNYSEYYPLAAIATDERGCASFTTGLGDLLLWASKDDAYSYAKADVRQHDTVALVLNRRGSDAAQYVEQLDMVPPAPGPVGVNPTSVEMASNQRRLAFEDSLRLAYTATFPTPSDCGRFSHPNANLPEQQRCELLCKSEGNYQQLALFLNAHATLDTTLDLYTYLKSFSDKDLRDISSDVLESHLTRRAHFSFPADVWQRGLMPARISNELIRPWREPLRKALSADLLHDGLPLSASGVRQWVLQNIACDDSGNYYDCPISPLGVYQLRHSDRHSRDIFFVAACRSLGIPAYLDNATNQIFAFVDGRWMPVAFDQSLPSLSAHLTLTYDGTDPKRPVYGPHFALARYVDGDFVSLDFEDDARLQSFPATLSLEPGYYCLFTGNRYPDGEVLSRIVFFNLDDASPLSLPIVLRPLSDKAGDTASVRVPNFKQLQLENGALSVAYLVGDIGLVYIDLGDYREPSKHLINELLVLTDQLRQWKGMLYVTQTPSEHKAITGQWDLTNIYFTQRQPDAPDALHQALRLASHRSDAVVYPVVSVLSPDGRVLLYNEGYKIGLGTEIISLLAKMASSNPPDDE